MRECPHCGCVIVKGRSGPDHRRFFALISAAFGSWPESHEYQPDSPEALRSWLTCKAGYRESTPIMLPDEASDHMKMLFRLGIEAALNASDKTAFVVPYRDGVAVIRPRSIAFDKIGQREFAEVRTAVEDVIKAETGLDPEALLREQAA